MVLVQVIVTMSTIVSGILCLIIRLIQGLINRLSQVTKKESREEGQLNLPIEKRTKNKNL